MTDNGGLTAEGALELLKNIAPSLVSRATFVVAQQGNSLPDLFRLPLTEALRNEFLRVDIDNVNAFSDKVPMEYMSSRVIPDGHLMWTLASGVQLLSTLDIEDDSKRAIPVYDTQILTSRNLKMTITTSASDLAPKQVVTFYRITRNTARLAKARRVAGILRNGAFDKLDDEVVLFNNEVDAISFGGFIFFLKKGVFERSFGFVEGLKRQAGATFDEVIGPLAIDGSDELRRAVTSDINMMAKMASIKRKLDANLSYAKAMTMDNLLAFVDANPHIDVEVVGEGADRSFVFRTAPSSRYKILKLLDDDFLTSELTELDYLVDSKGDPFNV
ncbi:Kiwa anti-phage protein KwaB-like domain-containing protein [Amycolatopsis thermoflava]|uniref:Uncharacterized protein DUF4868 n=1 Tax=Amycolatopsis thermoflava TaxID=84480 RepID=A0A3N2GRX7_9PSEU|nr:Kiwa anti-phage protein KwaB-like domain-containing protein [Amycolatopsis thermoflava]ROS39388.1 uncharacterized protein DUF4868 [Amycolatopsis thermoflava]